MSQKAISFARGAPSVDIIPVEGLKDAAQKVFASDPAGAFSYGTAVGYLPLREWIAAKHGVGVDQVMVTNGSMQADAFLFEQLVGSGDEVVVEAPTYDRTLLSLVKRGADVLALPLEVDGIDTGALEVSLEARSPKLAHIIPTFQNPAGYTLSFEKRKKLLELAQQKKFIIFEDDPYFDIRFEGDAIPTMLSMDESSSVVYASSFSKTICPGVRVGYLVGPADLIADLVKLATETYIAPNMAAQSIVSEICRSGAIDRSIATVKEALKERSETLCSALASEIPQAQFEKPQGGYFLWVDIPGIDVAKLEPLAKEEGVQFVKGTDFFLSGGESNLRLAYSAVTPKEITEGVARLARAIERL